MSPRLSIPAPPSPDSGRGAAHSRRFSCPGVVGNLALVFRLAMADAVHERVFSLCTVAALVAVTTPLLLLFAVKEGAMERIRTQLIQDPRNREIRAISSARFDRAWFEQSARHPSVAFIVPATRGLAASGTLWLPSRSRSTDVDLAPTAARDPLLVENRCGIPGERECVLTAAAAEAIGATAGDELDLAINRIKDGAMETAMVRLRVAGVLPPIASGLNTAFLTVPMMEAVEDFKDGRAVARLGWPGAARIATPLYDGAMLLTRRPLDPKVLDGIARENLCPSPETLTAATLLSRYGMECPTGGRAYIFGDGRGIYEPPAAAQLAAALAAAGNGEESGGGALPWARPRDVDIEDTSGRTLRSLRLVGLPDSTEWKGSELERRPLMSFAFPQFSWTDRLGATNDPFTLWLPVWTNGGTWPARARLVFRTAKSELRVPVSIVSVERGGPELGFGSMGLAAMLNASARKPIAYDPVGRNFLTLRESHAGFRLYADDIRSVLPLQRYLEAQGCHVATEARRIEEVLTWDRNLSFLFWLISAVGITGLAAFLGASLLAAVERKRRSLSVLGLLGIPASRLALFPIFQSILLMFAASLIACPVAAGISVFLDRRLAERIEVPGTSTPISAFRARHVVSFFGVAGAVAAATATAAAARIRRSDLSSGLRHEQ